MVAGVEERPFLVSLSGILPRQGAENATPGDIAHSVHRTYVDGAIGL